MHRGLAQASKEAKVKAKGPSRKQKHGSPSLSSFWQKTTLSLSKGGLSRAKKVAHLFLAFKAPFGPPSCVFFHWTTLPHSKKMNHFCLASS